MAVDLFEQLAVTNVPPPPTTFDRDVHQRLNKRLLAMHVLDFSTRGMAYCFVHLLAGFVGFVFFTLTGRYPTPRGPGQRRDPS